MSKQSVKTTINDNIKQNGHQEITGQIMNSVLNEMVDNLAEEASTTEKLTELKTILGNFLPVQFEEKSSGWQLVELGFAAPIGETLILCNTYGGTITVLQLKRQDGTNIREESVSIAPGNNYQITIPDGLAKIRIFTASGGFRIALMLNVKNLANVVAPMGNDINNIKTEIGYPAKFNFLNGWQVSPYTFTDGKQYIIQNTGSAAILSLQIRKSGVTKVEYNNLAAGDFLKITAPSGGGDEIRVYGPAIVSIYNESSIFYSLTEKVDKSDIKQVCGNSATDLMSQMAITKNIDSILIDAPDYLKGIVGFMFFKQPSAGMPDIDEYTQFRISRYYHNSSFYLILGLQIYYNGEWIAYDSVEITMASAPVNPPQVEKFASKYGAFFVWVNWSLMGTVAQSTIDVKIKNTAINYADRMLYDKQQQIIQAQNFGAYELKDYVKHNVFVDANGNGDFTTIAAAYASIKDSSYMNQYDVIVMPGVYNEVGLVPPIYTHTHAMNPNTVVVTSVGLTPQGLPPVFDITGVGCKLSNMTIISGFGYCIHLDESLGYSIFVAENLICKKDYGADVRNFGWKSGAYFNPTIIGCGSDYGGAKWIFNGCTFVDGWVACHSVPSPVTGYADSYANQHYILRNCKLVNAIIQMISLVPTDYINYGFNVCEITGLYTKRGCPSLEMYFSLLDGQPNIQWQIIGSNNENFVVQFNNREGGNVEYWPAIALATKTLCELDSSVESVEKGQWITINNTVCQGGENINEIFGIALESIEDGHEIQCWVGKAISYVSANGEYGIGSDGKLSASATNKIGFVKNNIFYLY